CELAKAPAASYLLACTPGQNARLTCTVPAGSAPQVVRACDYSAALHTGIPCTYQDSITNGIVDPSLPAVLAITCPSPRDSQEPGGMISIYQGAAYNGDAAAQVH